MPSTSRLLAIGDIHGYLTPFQTLVKELDFQQEDTVVVLGDVIDRGPQSRQVVDLLIELSRQTKLVCLKGNHEIMLEQAANDRSAVAYWLSFGGEATMDSYRARSFDDIPRSHWDFFESLLPHYETENEIFVHASLATDLDLTDQTEDDLYWTFFENPQPHKSGKRMICGHTPQANHQPKHLGFATCIDTAITNEGWLTCLDVRTNEFWQADQDGNVRKGSLSSSLG